MPRWPALSWTAWAASDKGESGKVDRWRLEVLDVQRRATTRVRLLMP